MAQIDRDHLRNLKRALVQLVTTFIVLVIVLVGYSAFAENRGKQKANDFCATVQLGSSIIGLIERAAEANAEQRYLKWHLGLNEYESDVLEVVFTGVMPLSRHMCIVEAKSERVLRVRYIYLD